MERRPSWKVYQASQELSCLIWNFITAFTRARHVSLSWAS